MARMLFLRDIDADVQLRCRACGHGGVLPRAMLERRFGPNYPVLSIAPHYRCSRCDSRDIESRPILDVPQVASPAASDDEPSFDAPLAALNGLLASLRGDGAPDGVADREPAAAPPPPAPVRAKPLSDLPLSDLVADGPGDEGVAPLWEPVSLADMAARLGRTAPHDDWDDAPPASDARTPANDARPDSTGEDSRDDGGSEDGNSEDGDETLMAMRQLLAQAYGSDDDQDDEREDGRDGGWNGGPPASHARHTTSFAEHPSVDEPAVDEPACEEPGQNDHGRNDPPAFSHKVLVRRDFEDDWADADDDSWEAEAGGQEDDLDAGESDGEEPSEEEILSFAIRDPEKPASVSRPAKPVPPPAAEPLDFDQHRAERRAQRPPPPEDEEGFDRTLAALRSMIEDAATEPEEEDAPPRKGSGNGGQPADKSARREDQDPTDGWDDPEPLAEPAVSRAAEPDPEPAPAGRRSAQEREIEEAMKALRGLIEDEVKPDLPAPPPSPPQPKPRTGKPRPARSGSAAPDAGRPQNGQPGNAQPANVPPPDVQSPETPSNGIQPGKPAGEPTPLSKTIAALRGMLELDGRRKR